MLKRLYSIVSISFIGLVAVSAIQHPKYAETSDVRESLLFQDKKDKQLLALLDADPEYKNLSAQEQEVFYWVNFVRLYPSRYWDEFAAPAIKKQNSNRFTNSLKRDLDKMSPVSVLKVSSQLQQASSYHANDLIKSRKFQHNSSNGESFDKRLKRFWPGSTIAENIHLGAGTPFSAVLSLLIDEKVPGSGHRESILSPDYNIAGMTYKNYQDGKNILVQDFGKLN